MENLSLAMRQAVWLGEPIEAEGLTLYPILVKELGSFAVARPALETLQQSLPVKWLSVPILSAYYGMDFEAAQEGTESSGLLYRAILLLALSLRLGEGRPDEERVNLIQFVIDPENPQKLKGLRFTVRGEERHEITPVQYSKLVPIMAAQNGVELPSADANPELVEAERDLAEMRGPKLDLSTEALISSIATLSGSEEAEIMNWTILKLRSRQETYNRLLHFLVCGIGEASGARWKGGNPYPSPFFDRLKEGSGALIAMEDFADGKGLQAVENAGMNVT